MKRADTPWGALELMRAPAPTPSRYPRSYDSAGRCLVWKPTEAFLSFRLACDIEDLRRPVPSVLFRRYRTQNRSDFLIRWTRTEVFAKLFRVPLLIWLSAHGLEDPGVYSPRPFGLLTLEWEGKIISLGYDTRHIHESPRRRYR